MSREEQGAGIAGCKAESLGQPEIGIAAKGGGIYECEDEGAFATALRRLTS